MKYETELKKITRSQAIKKLLKLYAEFASQDLDLASLAKKIQEKGPSKPTAYNYAHAVQIIKSIKLGEQSSQPKCINDEKTEKVLKNLISTFDKAQNWMHYYSVPKEKRLQGIGKVLDELYEYLIEMKSLFEQAQT